MNDVLKFAEELKELVDEHEFYYDDKYMVYGMIGYLLEKYSHSPQTKPKSETGQSRRRIPEVAVVETNQTAMDKTADISLTDEIDKVVDKWLVSHKTSWKYMKRKGFEEAENYGDLVFIKLFEKDCFQDLKNDLKQKIKEKLK